MVAPFILYAMENHNPSVNIPLVLNLEQGSEQVQNVIPITSVHAEIVEYASDEDESYQEQDFWSSLFIAYLLHRVKN